MSLTDTPFDATAPATPAKRTWEGALLDRLIPSLAVGSLKVRTPAGAMFARSGSVPGPEATLVLHRWRAVLRLLLGGDIGFGEAFVDGDWSSPDLVALLRLLAQNQDALRRTVRGVGVLRLSSILRHLSRANSRAGSRRNIMAHYDLGNDFYRRWLDQRMLYSSALWSEDAPSLEAAQVAKLDRIAALLELAPGQQLLEIGCGWGALAVHLAAKAAVRVAGVTLSPAQIAWAKDAAAAAELGHRVDLRLQDYRDVQGRYDRIVSIEMFEAVGEAWWPTYFQTIAKHLAPDGRAVLQVITIADERFQSYRRDTDFIQKHIFPGGFLPSPAAFQKAVRAAGLKIAHRETFGLSYAETLAEWRRRFHDAWDEIVALGFDDGFRRLWDYYLAYCEAGFREGAIDVGLYCLTPGEG